MRLPKKINKTPLFRRKKDGRYAFFDVECMGIDPRRLGLLARQVRAESRNETRPLPLPCGPLKRAAKWGQYSMTYALHPSWVVSWCQATVQSLDAQCHHAIAGASGRHRGVHVTCGLPLGSLARPRRWLKTEP